MAGDCSARSATILVAASRTSELVDWSSAERVEILIAEAADLAMFWLWEGRRIVPFWVCLLTLLEEDGGGK